MKEMWVTIFDFMVFCVVI